MALNSTVARVTERIIERSAPTRQPYLERMRAAGEQGPARAHLSCSGQAHAYAAAGEDQAELATGSAGNLGIVTAYNDMLSAHQPFERFPELLREAARSVGGRRRWRAVCLPCATGSRRARPDGVEPVFA